MRTLTVVGIELDDTNVHDKEVLMNIETTTGRILPVAVKETWLSTTVQRVDKKHMTGLTRVAIPNDIFFRRYFKIVEE